MYTSYGSMFSGIDAPYHALNSFDLSVHYYFAIENDRKVIEILTRNAQPGLLLQNDVQDVNLDLLPRVDIFACSPPCQSFSSLGRRDPNDARRELWRYGMRYVATKEPFYAIFENVVGFARSEFPAFKTAIPDGYHCFDRILDASDFGSLQHRERHFIILKRMPRISWPVQRYLDRRLDSILEPDVPPKYYYTDRGIAYLARRKQWGNNVLTGDSTTVPCFCRSFGNQSVHWKHTGPST